MDRIASPIPVGTRLTDSVTLVDAAHAASLKAAGVDGILQYLGSVTAAGVETAMVAGLGFMPCTYADKFDGPATVRQLMKLGLPPDVTVWLDVEGVKNMDPATLIGAINTWAVAVQRAGFMAGMYVGAAALLTSQELFALKVTRYWKALSRITDRNGSLAEPACGWCMTQLYPSKTTGGVWTDVDFVGQDFQGRVPSWCIAA